MHRVTKFNPHSIILTFLQATTSQRTPRHLPHHPPSHSHPFTPLQHLSTHQLSTPHLPLSHYHSSPPASSAIPAASSYLHDQASAQDDRLSGLVEMLFQCRRSTSLHQLDRLQKLVLLLKESEVIAEKTRKGLIPILEEFMGSGQQKLEQQARLALSLVGYAPPYEGRGIRILSLDGGGMRGLIPILLLRRLEELCNMETHRMFDYVCGTSTGAILASLLCFRRVSMDEVESMYRELGTEVFRMNNLLGIGQLFLNHAFYDAKLLEKLLRKQPHAESLMIETASYPHVPRVSFVSTAVNRPVIQPFLFCNYRLPPDSLPDSHYLRDTNVRIWEAVRASTAAPGYFEEVKLGPHVHQDGGLLTNNPCAIALHEAKLLWGQSTPIQCIISMGTGIYRRAPESNSSGSSLNSTSLREKLTKIVASATDTEAVHTILNGLLPPHTYFRFNPELSSDIPIDESKPEKLEELVCDANHYVETNREKLERAAACILAPKTPSQKAKEWVNSHWRNVLHQTSHFKLSR